MPLTVRTITEAEAPAWFAALGTGFLYPPTDAAATAELLLPMHHQDRTWAGFDGDRVVATLRSFPTRLTVPGGRTVPAGAVTAVSTTSTHRRQGLASRLVGAELAASAARGEQVSILIPTEGAIYRRFGYGPATERQAVTVDVTATWAGDRPEGRVEHVDRDTARAVAADVHERARSWRPGQMAREDFFWDLEFGIVRPPAWPDPGPAFHVIARDAAGAACGMASYTVERRKEHRRPAGTVTVRTFVTAGPAGDALLWHHLLNIDLVTTVHAEDRPVDEVLPWLLADPRAAMPAERSDFLWVRPLDVAGMLAARTYLAAGRVVVEVVDPAGYAAGRYVLDGGPDGATCARTDAPADLTLDAAALGSVYLGGFPLRALADARLVVEHAAGAVARADAMFRSPVTPWCAFVF